MKAFILCGGLGTRIRSLIGETQKAVADIQGEPFLTSIIEELSAATIQDLVFCTHYQSEQVEAAVEKISANFALKTQIIREPVLMGTGGALLYALSVTHYRGRFIVLNADTFVKEDAYELALQASSPQMVITKMDDCSRYGAIEFDDHKCVLKMIEKGFSNEGYINVGIYSFHTDDLSEFDVAPCSMENDILPILIEKKALYAKEYQGPFIDIGVPDSLKFMRDYKRKD